MPSLYQLKCSSCGAPLSVPEEVNTFACKYCGNEQKLLKRGDTVTLVASVNAMAATTERIATELAIQRLEKEISRFPPQYTLERSIEEQRESLRKLQSWVSQLSEPPHEFRLDDAFPPRGELKVLIYVFGITLAPLILLFFYFWPLALFFLAIWLFYASVSLVVPAIQGFVSHQKWIEGQPILLEENKAKLDAEKAELASLENELSKRVLPLEEMKAEKQRLEGILRQAS